MRLTVTALMLAFVVGCGSNPDTKTDTKTDSKGDTKKPDPKGNTTPKATESPKASATEFVETFFAALKTKKATADQLTPDFKKIIAPPFGAEDAAKGYSDALAKDYLDSWSAVTSDKPTVDVIGEVGFASGKPGPGGRILARLVMEGGAWKVDWLSNGPANATETTLSAENPAAAAQFVAVAFTDAILKKDFPLAAALMTPEGRVRVAPPLSTDKERGYNLSLLKDEMNRAFGSVDKVESYGASLNDKGATAWVKVVTITKKTEVTVKLVTTARAGIYLIESFEAK